MIPKQMEVFLKSSIPEGTWSNRLIKQNGLCYIEFSPLDIDRLARLGIEVDNLGPRLVVCMWDESSSLEIGGYLVIDNLAMGQPAMGGIRMLPDVTPSSIHNLARGMTLKNAAAHLPYGGGKSGIVAERSLKPSEHTEVVRGFARLLYRYRDVYLPGPDVGTNDHDMRTVAIYNGLDNALSKPVEMGGNRIDDLGAAAGGIIIALQTLLEEMPRLKVLPQFVNLCIPEPDQLTIMIQGFGAVGAHASRIIGERISGARVIGISDALGYLYDEVGLPVQELFKLWREHGLVTLPFYQQHIQPPTGAAFHKFSNSPNDLLRESAFCLIPAAPISNYLDIDASSQPCITTKQMGDWWVIIEGANTYSPESKRKIARAKMERSVYRDRGVLIATDYLVNSGGVIYAAQEHMIKTPDHLRIPDVMLGDADAVDLWLGKFENDFAILADRRHLAGRELRDTVIRRNMHEFIELLISNSDMLPAEAAERISIGRIEISERDRTAAEIMTTIPTIVVNKTIQDAAGIMIDNNCSIVAVINNNDELVGVVTEWDITRATAIGIPNLKSVEEIMSQNVIYADPSDSLIDLVRKLEYHEITAMPVVNGSGVIGMISTDVLARKSLLRLLQSKI